MFALMRPLENTAIFIGLYPYRKWDVERKWSFFKIFLALTFLFFICTVVKASNSKILTQDMVNKGRNEFVVDRRYSLNGKQIKLPNGFKLIFNGGSFENGEIVGNKSYVIFKGKKSGFKKDTKIKGTWQNHDIYDFWFEFDESPQFVANSLINNILSMSNDNSFCHIHFDEPRTYHFELPYKGPTNLGERISYEMKDGKKRRHWYELYDDKFSFLRIFTIPSNTHITINSRFQMIPTNQGAYFVFWEYGKQNVTIDGNGVISGETLNHRYETPFKEPNSNYFGEWGMLLYCMKCKNIKVRNVSFENAFGDAVTFCGSFLNSEKGKRFADGFSMENVKIYNARRNGLTLGGRNISIKNCYFEGCGSDKVKGTSPRSAIDLEPDHIKKYSEIGNENVLIENCTFINNFRDLASYMNNLPKYGKVATKIKGCKFTSAVHLQATYWMVFENCSIPRITNSDNKLSYSQHCRRLQFKNCEFGLIDRSELTSALLRRNTFADCKYKKIVNGDL